MNSSNNGFRASAVELFSRKMEHSNDDKKIYSRDVDNKYPERVENIINNSPTARRCAMMMSKFIAGAGVESGKNIIVNTKGDKINDIIEQASDCIAEQYGVYFYIKYRLDTEDIANLNFKVGNIEILDYVRMAKSKEDDENYQGRYFLLEKEEKNSLFSKTNNNTRWFYPYNSDKRVILEQMKHDCKLKGIENPTIQQLLKNYRGQVFYLNLTPKYIYALPLVDSVYNDCDTEYRLGLYNNTQTRIGFLGQTVVVKFSDDVDENPRHSNDVTLTDQIKESLGAENSANVLVVDVPLGATEDLNKAFVVNQLKPQFDDKLFTNLEKSLEKKIMRAFNNIPDALVSSGDGALFGVNAETYEQMKRFYWEQNERERSKLERTLRMFGYDVEIRYFQIEKEHKDELQ